MARIVDFYQRIYRARAVDKICSKKTRIFVHGIPYSPGTPSLEGHDYFYREINLQKLKMSYAERLCHMTARCGDETRGRERRGRIPHRLALKRTLTNPRSYM